MSEHRFLCIVLLLSLQNGALGSINPDHLNSIINYITSYGTTDNSHYAVAARLDGQYCQDPTRANLQAALPKSVMEAMKSAINVKNGIYIPNPVGNIVAARPIIEGKAKHAEWRLLNGGQNSPTAKILENKPPDSCLIFFSKLSPCTDRCLNLNDMRNFVQWLNPLFNRISQDSRAFVFKFVYKKDSKKEPEVIVEAWKTIKHAPLFRCDGNKCIQCFDNNDHLNPKCLSKKVAKIVVAKTVMEYPGLIAL